MAADASAQFILNVAVACASADGAQLVNSATATSTTADPNTAPNNTAAAKVTVSNPPPTITRIGTDTMTVECHTSTILLPGIKIIINGQTIRINGNTTNDIVIGPDCRSVRLRAERDNNGNGRVYTVTLRVREVSGNTTTRTAKVTVPRGLGIGAAVDNGPRYTVTGCP